jgi:predicted RNA polymerase sigma factor
MVTLNRAVAAAMVDGPTRASRCDGIANRLAGHHRLDAVRAHLLEMAGDRDAAIAYYRTAPGHTTSVAERDYLPYVRHTTLEPRPTQEPAAFIGAGSPHP